MTSTTKQFADLFAETKLKVYKPGDMVEGVIFAQGSNKIWVDIPGRGLGIIYASELTADTPEFNKGDKI